MEKRTSLGAEGSEAIGQGLKPIKCVAVISELKLRSPGAKHFCLLAVKAQNARVTTV